LIARFSKSQRSHRLVQRLPSTVERSCRALSVICQPNSKIPIPHHPGGNNQEHQIYCGIEARNIYRHTAFE
jgi:hypothetical protein